MTDERDLHDAALDAWLRAHSAETPAPAVDAAVLAAAHRAVAGEPRGRSARATQPWRWWMPLAAAAAIGVVVIGIAPLAPTLVEPPPSTPANSPARAVAPAAPAQESAGASLDAQRSRPAPTMPREAAPVAKMSATPESAAESKAASAAGAAHPSSPSARSDAASADRRELPVAQPRTADEWIARIRTLRNDGRLPEATRALAGFRAAFDDADARLPDDLRDWARTLR